MPTKMSNDVCIIIQALTVLSICSKGKAGYAKGNIEQHILVGLKGDLGCPISFGK